MDRGFIIYPMADTGCTLQVCCAPTKFEGDMKILQIDGVEAVFKPDYEKPESILYRNLNDKVCIAVDASLENSDAGSNMERCSVSSFRKGSIVATFLMEFPPETKDISAELTTTLQEAFDSSDDDRITALTVDPSSITVKEFVPNTGIAVGVVAAVAIIVVVIVLVVKKTGRSARVQDVETGADSAVVSRQEPNFDNRNCPR